MESSLFLATGPDFQALSLLSTISGSESEATEGVENLREIALLNIGPVQREIEKRRNWKNIRVVA